jgi:hypothetical protein
LARRNQGVLAIGCNIYRFVVPLGYENKSNVSFKCVIKEVSAMKQLKFNTTQMATLVLVMTVYPAIATSAQQDVQQLQQLAPYKGYIAAHRKEQSPYNILGGPLNIPMLHSGVLASC